MWTGLYLYQSQIPVAKALCECTFTVSDSYFYDSDDYFGPSPKDHRVGVLSNFLWNVSHIIKLLRVVASWHLLQDEDNYVWAVAIYPQGIHFIFTIYFKNLQLSSFPDKWNLKSWGRWSLTGKADSPQFVYIYFTAMTNRMSWYILSKLWNSYLQKDYKWN